MSTTHILDTIILPGDMEWTDRWWNPFEQVETRTVTGRLIIEPSAKIGGRPITLDGLPGDNWNGAWIYDDTLNELYGKLTPGNEMELVLSTGESKSVTWRVPGIEVKRIDGQYPPISGSRYCVRLNFWEI